jgi:hypothetical protein
MHAKVILRPTVSRRVSVGVRHPFVARDNFLKLSLDSCEVVDVGRPLVRVENIQTRVISYLVRQHKYGYKLIP